MDENRSDEIENRLAFLAEAPARDVVRTVIILLRSHREYELECLDAILATSPAPFMTRLAAIWLELKAESMGTVKAMRLLSQTITAELDGALL